MNKKTHSIDMTQGSILKNVIRFIIPLIIGNILQLLYNAADLIVVSRWAGSSAMASVGATGALCTLVVNLCIGLSVGAGVIVSRNFGAKNDEALNRSVHTSIAVSIISGLLGMFFGITLARPFLVLLGTPEGKVLDGAIIYMCIYFAGFPASMIYNFGASILRAIGDTKRPLYILSASGIVNVLLNLILVIKFHMGVAGVAIATAVASYISAIIVIVILRKTDGPCKLCLRKVKFHKSELRTILKIGIPAGIQGAVFSVSNALIQFAVNSFGTAAISGSAAASNIEGFVYTAMNAFYQATLTSVSQNYGAGKEKRVYKSILTCIYSVSIVGFLLGALTVIFDDELLRIYITDSVEAIEFAKIKMLYAGLPYFLCGIMEVLAGALRGIGHSKTGMINSLIGACGMRVLWVIFVLPLHRTPGTLFFCWSVSWVIVIIMHAISFLVLRKKSFQAVGVKNG